jgi:polysaccharide biosynthesis protein PslG
MRPTQRMLRLACVCFGSLAAAAILAAVASAEPVPTVPTADAATTGLWLFQEGQGDRVASAIKDGPAGKVHGATWVPGINGYALATHSGYLSIPDAPALRPAKAITVEIWVKLSRPGGDLVCKNGVYCFRLGGSSMNTLLAVDGKRWQTIGGQRAVPVGKWTHLALTYDSATKTAAVYIDGHLDAKQEFKDLATGLVNQGTAELRLGTNDWRPNGAEADGKIAAVRISNIARTFEPAAAPGAAPAPAPVAKGNLVPNGDFELGLMGWRLAGEGDATLLWGPDTTNPASGKLCLRTLPGAAGSTDLRDPAPQDALLSRPITATPGGHYVMSAKMRSDAAGRKASISANPVGGGRRSGRGNLSQSVDLGTEWKQVSRAITLPDDWTAPSLCLRIDHPRGGQLWVDDVRLVAGDDVNALTLGDKICVGPKTTPLGHLYFAGQTGTAPLNVVNTDAKAHTVSVKAIATDWEGRELPAVEVGKFDLPAGSVKEVPFSIDSKHRGSYRLGFELTAEGQTWRQAAQFKYSVIVPLKGVGDADNSFFAMNTHMEREPSAHLAHSMEVLSQCGVKWIRAWWGWGMCEKERGKYDWNEYDRQFKAVDDAKMLIMPILLRYYSSYEYEWTGPITERNPNRAGQAPIQEYPRESVLPDWTAWAGKIAERFKGRIPAYEVWNEPTMGSAPHGVLTPKQYAVLLNATTPAIRKADPKAKIVGFAGVEPPFIKDTLALGVAGTMDIVSEHSYAQLKQPETHLTKRMEEVRALLAANGCENKPIWHTEQGNGGDDDGYMAPSESDADGAALFMRNIVVGRAVGIAKNFWFSAQTSPTYGYAVFYEDYVPRPKLAALNACATFIEGTTYRKTFRPGKSAYAYLFEGKQPVCAVWNLNGPARLTLPTPIDSLRAYDMMGNEFPIEVLQHHGTEVLLPAERPVYLSVAAGRYAALEKAIAEAKAVDVPPVAVKTSAAEGGISVTVSNQSRSPQDGVVELLPPAGDTAVGAPAAQHFQSLKPGESKTFKFTAPGKPAVRVRVGDREMLEVKG